MRLFVGVEVGSAIAKAGGALIEELRRRVEARAPRARVTWVAPERLHVTVRFIGASDESRSRAIHAALEAPLEIPSFALGVQGVGVFPMRGAPRVFWAGLTVGRDGLVSVENEVSTRLAALVPREDRPYAPHLTLARVKDAAGLARAGVLQGLDGVVLGQVQVEAITLFESVLSSKGPTYVPRQRTALRAHS